MWTVVSRILPSAQRSKERKLADLRGVYEYAAGPAPTTAHPSPCAYATHTARISSRFCGLANRNCVRVGVANYGRRLDCSWLSRLGPVTDPHNHTFGGGSFLLNTCRRSGSRDY